MGVFYKLGFECVVGKEEFGDQGLVGQGGGVVGGEPLIDGGFLVCVAVLQDDGVADDVLGDGAKEGVGDVGVVRDAEALNLFHELLHLRFPLGGWRFRGGGHDDVVGRQAADKGAGRAVLLMFPPRVVSLFPADERDAAAKAFAAIQASRRPWDVVEASFGQAPGLGLEIGSQGPGRRRGREALQANCFVAKVVVIPVDERAVRVVSQVLCSGVRTGFPASHSGPTTKTSHPIRSSGNRLEEKAALR